MKNKPDLDMFPENMSQYTSLPLKYLKTSLFLGG